MLLTPGLPLQGDDMSDPLNLASDAGAETNDPEAPGWILEDGWSYSDENPRSGLYSLKFDSSVATSGLAITRPFIRVIPGQRFYFEVPVEATDSASDLGTMTVGVQFYDALQFPIAGVPGSGVSTVSGAAPTDYEEGVLVAGPVAPDDAAYARFFASAAGVNDGAWYVDDVHWQLALKLKDVLNDVVTLGREDQTYILIHNKQGKITLKADGQGDDPLNLVYIDAETTEHTGATVLPTIGPSAGVQHIVPGGTPGTLALQSYVDALLAANDALTFEGVIDCSANPNYPAADAGHVYKVSVAGKIGGASGPNVEAGDVLTCIVDASASGNHATVGANWVIQQGNIDGAVTGQSSSVDSEIALFSGTSGKVIKRATQTGLARLTSGVLSAGTVGTADVDNDAVTNAKAADMATKTYKGRTTAGTGDPEDVPVATLKTDLALTKSDVGLSNVDNTADSAKPVSTAQQAALDAKAKLADLQTFDASGTWNKPAGAQMVRVVCVGAGGGGGGGVGGAAGTNRNGGSGGGGGYFTERWFRASDLGATVAITVGVGGTGGTGGSSANGGDGTAGGNSSFGSHVTAYGGGFGKGGVAGTATSGGAGGGSGGVGGNGATTDSTGGLPASTAGSSGISGQGAGCVAGANAGGSAEQGGGAGGGVTATTVTTSGAGGGSIQGAGGGGAGGGRVAANTNFSAGVGGKVQGYSSGGGGAAGSVGTTGNPGTAGTAGNSTKCGTGGGGGGAGSTGNGGNGGDGGALGGGAGGGGGGTSTGGNGGAGGRGEVRVATFF